MSKDTTAQELRAAIDAIRASWHESFLDNTVAITDLFDRLIDKHWLMAFDRMGDGKVAKLCDQIGDLLGDLYQAAGAIDLDESNPQ